jgi:hypothetical protein
MRSARGDVRDHMVPSKIDHEKQRSDRDVQKSTFARFLGLIDFRLLQQYRHFSDMPTTRANVRSRGAKRK